MAKMPAQIGRSPAASKEDTAPLRWSLLQFAGSICLILLLGGRLLAQSCAMCYTTAASGGSGIIQALRGGVLVLLFPPVLLFTGLILLIFRWRSATIEIDEATALPETVGSAGPVVTVRERLTTKLRDYSALTKPEVNLLVLMTTSAGYYLASRGPFHFAGLVNTLIGTLLVAAGTATLNQWMERLHDGRMRRTADRPLPAGRVQPRDALLFGATLGVSGVAYLAIEVNLLSAGLALFALLSYLLVYTPLKRKTALCTVLGAFPGATPTLIGWAGASATLGERAWLLFAVVFLWQFPHFLAIALMYRDDYARAGYHMLPSFDLDAQFTRTQIVTFSVLLTMVTFLPVLAAEEAKYVIGMALAGTFLLYHSLRLLRSEWKALPPRLVHASVIYLPVVLGLMMFGKV